MPCYLGTEGFTGENVAVVNGSGQFFALQGSPLMHGTRETRESAVAGSSEPSSMRSPLVGRVGYVGDTQKSLVWFVAVGFHERMFSLEDQLCLSQVLLALWQGRP